MNRMVNIWNQYQCMVTFNMSRSASYFESEYWKEGMGFRDSNQDLLGFVHRFLKEQEKFLTLLLPTIEDGGYFLKYQPFNKEGFNDKKLVEIS